MSHAMNFEAFIQRTWSRYIEITPDADRVCKLLLGRGETIVNDHVAYRTFNLPGVSRLELGAVFEAWGFQRQEDLRFPEKKLLATYWKHADPILPKVFISELLLEEVSPALRDWVVAGVGAPRLALGRPSPETFLTPSWEKPKFEDYSRFYRESEYAAWTMAFGIQANHFTVFVNALKSVASLQELNALLIQSGIPMSESGGLVKGTPAEKLEQSSTQARRIPWEFCGGHQAEIMSCYYEFARRYPKDSTGELFHGFVPSSANKIFESNFESKK